MGKGSISNLSKSLAVSLHPHITTLLGASNTTADKVMSQADYTSHVDNAVPPAHRGMRVHVFR